MSANNNNNNSSSKSKAVAKPIAPVPNKDAPICISVPTEILKQRKTCEPWCACGKSSLDIRKRKTMVQIDRFVGWFGNGSVAPKQDGSTDPNKALRVNCLLKTIKGRRYYDVHNYWITFTNHAEDPNLASYVGDFSAFARGKGFIDCLAFEDFQTKEWTIHPNDLKKKIAEEQTRAKQLSEERKKEPKKTERKGKRSVNQDDLDILLSENPAKASEENSKFIYTGESDSDDDSDQNMDDDQSEENKEGFDEKSFRAEFEKTEPIAISSDDESEEGKNCANTLEQFKKESKTAFTFTPSPQEEEDAFDDKTVETTDPTELVEDSIAVNNTNDFSVDATLDKTVPVEHSISDIHTELANILASNMDDKPTEEKKKEDDDDLDFLLDFDFRRECEPSKEAPKVTESEEIIIQQAPVENKPEEVQPMEMQPEEPKPMEVQSEESKPEEVQPEEPKPEEVKPMEIESEKPTEPENDVQEAPAEAPTPVVENPIVEAPITETLVIPAVPEQPTTPQKVLGSGMTLRAKKQEEKKQTEKKQVSRTSRRKARNQ